METLLWILFGTIGGWIFSVIFEESNKDEFLKDLLLGVLGAVMGTLLINALGYRGTSIYNGLSVISASLFITLLMTIRRIGSDNKKEGAWQS